ncbi:hypothetical protein CAOG_06348 [Capsaspora owczarzaki ATCC 30864]|uniref:G-protein coupled receptors family 3 profile domain-containing protein n=1 Tax=Capsaspora owczarzaki (strain ATCC 30864) TaxID=595528 RepID=A0A0D2ULI0_CAPO3|nr:hypothetical protein CAOG_06348 [Capsaspora owczarzaki ATCC 30864]KJE95966.1 hypothetical protein, variant 1 [Capsaspora owczarzaki ATCC 30864]|eukprot:XP_004345097.2 hypothetical protein CAOG_06348 [Capsaspora owczarzaki ATCC 30864]
MHQLTVFSLLVAITLAGTASAACFPPNERRALRTDLAPIQIVANAWNSSMISATIARIVLEEKLGLPAQLYGMYGTYDESFAALSSGAGDLLMEAYPKYTQYLIDEYVTERRTVVYVGPSGIIGETGWYIPEYVWDVSTITDSYIAYYDERIQAMFRLNTIPVGFQLDNTTLRSAVDDIDLILESPACNAALNASLVAADCTATVEAFLELLRERANLKDEGEPITFWTMPDAWGTLDRVIVQNLSLNFNVTCPVSQTLGVDETMDAMVEVTKQSYIARKPFIQYWTKPHYVFADVSPARLHRVQLPEFDSTCNASSSAYRCGYEDQRVVKMMSSKLPSKNSVAADFVDHFSYTSQDQSNILGQMVFNGKSLEEATCEWVIANFAAMEPNLPDPSRLVTPTKVSPALRIAFIVVAAAELALFVLFIFGVIHYRRVRAVLSGSPKFLFLMLIGASWSMFWVILNYQEEVTPNLCIARVWARHLGFAIIFAAIFLKTWRIASVFNIKSSKGGQLTDRVLLYRFLLIVGYATVNLVAWSVSTPPTTGTVVSNNESYLVCEVTWWDNAIYIEELVAMVALGLLCYRVRKAPSAFNESKHIGLAVYNWIVMGIILQIILNSTTGTADFFFAIQSLEVLVPVPIAVMILMAPKFYLILRGKGNDVATSSYRGSNPNGSHPKTPSANAGGSGSNQKSGDMEMSSGNESENGRTAQLSGKAAVQEIRSLRNENTRLLKEVEAMRTQLLRMHNPHNGNAV